MTSDATSPFRVIGASTGLGRETARALARDHKVITAGRHAETDVKVELRDLADVARAAGELRALGPFAGIVCNAGVQQAGPSALTADKIEETFAVNVLAHFAFVMHLAASLEPHARVAFIGSGTLDPDDRGATRFGFRGGRYTSAQQLAAGEGDPSVDAAQNARDRYATSKLCNLLEAQAFARRGIDAFAFDPGLMLGTGLAKSHGLVARILWRTVLRLAAKFMRGQHPLGCGARTLHDHEGLHARRVLRLHENAAGNPGGRPELGPRRGLVCDVPRAREGGSAS